MNQPAYLNSNLPIYERVQDLLSRLTLDEKVAMMNHPAQGVPRLNIPAYNYWNEALHGVGRNGRATVFPQAIGMAATWDKDLIHQIATAISDEGRAKYNEALRRNGYTDQYQGLTFWSPNVNIFRDPRWGRGQETWGEDPFFVGGNGRRVCQRPAGRPSQIPQSGGLRQALCGPFRPRKRPPHLRCYRFQTRPVRYVSTGLQKAGH